MSDPFKPENRKIDIEGKSVMLAMPSHRDIYPDTVASLLATQRECFQRGIPLDVNITHGSSLPHHARTRIAWDFLQGKQDLLFWIDSDMVWQASDFIRVMALATVMPMVAGAYPAKQDPPLFLLNTDNPEEIDGNEWQCLKLTGIGLGFCCMQREVVEAVAAQAVPTKFLNTEAIPHIFRFGEAANGNAQGEDMAFFEDARKLGYDLWVDPSIKLGHVGPKVYTASLLDHLEAAAPSDKPAAVGAA